MSQAVGTPAPVGRRLGRFATFNVAQHAWLAMVSLVATPVLYHRLGEAAYGLLAVVNVVAAQLSILELGFGHATIRRISRHGGLDDPEELSRTLSTSTLVFLCTAAVGAAVLLAGADLLVERYFRIPPELLATGRTALRISAAFFAVTILGTLAGALWQGLQRFGYLNAVSAAAATAQLLGSVAIVLLGFGVLHVLAWTIVLGTASLAVHGWWLRRQAPGVRLFGRPSRQAFREMAGFGSLLMVAGILTQVFFSGGPLVLGHYVAIGALPFFTVPLGLYQRLNRMGYGVAAALYPLVAELDGLRDEPSLQRVYVSGTRVLLVAAATSMAPAVLVAGPFLSLWMGAGFAAEAGPVLEILFVSFGLSLATIPSVELSRGRGRASLLVAYTTLLAGVGLGGTVLLAPGLGPTGAALAFVTAQAAGSALLLLRVGGRSVSSVFTPRVLLHVVVAALVVVGVLTATASAWARLGAAVALGAALAASGIAWVLTPEERRSLRRMVGGS